MCFAYNPSAMSFRGSVLLTTKYRRRYLIFTARKCFICCSRFFSRFLASHPNPSRRYFFTVTAPTTRTRNLFVCDVYKNNKKSALSVFETPLFMTRAPPILGYCTPFPGSTFFTRGKNAEVASRRRRNKCTTIIFA